MGIQDTRVILIAPDGEKIFQESGGGAFSRTLRSLWAYAAQGLLHEDDEKTLVADFPEFRSALSHRVVKSHYYRLDAGHPPLPESRRKKPRALHQVFVIPSRTAALMFGHQHVAREVLMRFPVGEPCLVIIDDWSRAKKKNSPATPSSKKEEDAASWVPSESHRTH